MRIGFLIELNHGPYEQAFPSAKHASSVIDAIIESGITAEKAGFHGIQVPDRHGRTECYLPGPMQTLTMLARETDRVALGSFTYIATLYNPMQAAEEFAVLDNVSKGRVYSTLSRGFHTGYWDQFGVPQEKLLGRFKEFLAIWGLAFKGERFDFEGQHYQVKNGLLTPGPYQEGGWPIWGGGNASPAAIERSATYGDSWTCDPYPIMPEVWAEQTGRYRAKAEELGKKPHIVMMRDGWVADSFEDAKWEFGDYAVNEIRFYFDRGIFTHHPEFQKSSDITAERLAPHQILGTADQCIEQLERYHEDFGVDYFTMRFRMPEGPSLEAEHEQILRFGEEVVQPIHKKYPAPDHPAIPTGARF